MSGLSPFSYTLSPLPDSVDHIGALVSQFKPIYSYGVVNLAADDGGFLLAVHSWDVSCSIAVSDYSMSLYGWSGMSFDRGLC